MAARSQRNSASRVSFEKNTVLQRYFLKGVIMTGKELGRGSYGSVIEVKYQSTFCAAKELHELLLDPGNEGVSEVIKKYERECQLMATVSHPNLTRFLGLCFIGDAGLPLLVMERLEMSFDELLKGARNMSLMLKLTLLHDTCSGLVYLHSRQPPIIHRDLTARNVLISSSMCAKIADFGCSRMVNMKQGQLVQTMSKLPGTLVYMPPEALDGSHRYGSSLDIFSFGHLSLYSLIQESPENILSSTYPDPNNRECTIARSEVERRQPYMTKLETQFAHFPILLEFVSQSLHNAPERRPSSVDILRRLEEVKMEVKGITEDLPNHHTIDQDQMIQEIMARNSQLEGELLDLREKLGKMSASLQEDKGSSGKIPWARKSVKSRKTQLEAELQATIEQLEEMSSDLPEAKFQREKISHLRKSIKVKPKMNFPLQLDWKRCRNMPLAMGAYIQSVEIDGSLYIGGGWGEKDEGPYIVMVYDTKTSRMLILPPYSARTFGMATFKNKLVLVGGWHDGHNVDQLGVWNNEWIYPLPPMPTSCQAPSTTSYKHWLVVAGGSDGKKSISNVQILDIDTMQWSTGPSTCTPWDQMKSTVVGDTWYLMGGGFNNSDVPDVYSASLEDLVSPSMYDTTIWKKIASLNSIYSSPLNAGGSLFAIGGWNKEKNQLESIIQCYLPETNQWVHAGTVPHRLCTCTCIMSSHNVYVMGGHDGSRAFSTTYMAYFEDVHSN